MNLQSGRASVCYANGNSSRPTPHRAFTAGQRELARNTEERWVTRDDGRKPHEPEGFTWVHLACRMSHVQSHLARYQPRAATSDGQRLALMARAWIDDGIICLKPEQITNDILRQACITAVEQAYGKRADG